MEAAAMDEDSKQFDAMNGGHDDDNQPDPDEPLMMDAGLGKVWLVKVRPPWPPPHVEPAHSCCPRVILKIPRHLMERWSAIDEEGVHLASIRIYHQAESSLGRRPRIVLTLPPDPKHPEEPDEYEMDMVNHDVENQIVIAEREKAPRTASRARTTILTGSVKHECNMRPTRRVCSAISCSTSSSVCSRSANAGRSRSCAAHAAARGEPQRGAPQHYARTAAKAAATTTRAARAKM